MFSLPALAGLGTAVLATSFLSGLFGMAGGMVLMGILLLFLPVPAAMVLHGIAQMASNGWRAWLWRAYVDWGIVTRYVAGGLAAVALFAAVRFVPDKAVALIILGLTPFAGRALPHSFAPNVDRRGHSAVCGFVCVGLQLMAGVSGPLLDMFFVKAALDRRQVVATKALSQTFGHGLKLVYFGGLIGTAGDVIGPAVIGLAVACALIGTTLSRRILDAMTDHQFRHWTQRLITSMGLVYLGQGLWLLLVH